MPYLVNIQDDPRYDERDVSWTAGRYQQYQAYLESIREKLPLRAYDFATAKWHYSTDDSRGLHDSVVQEFVLQPGRAYKGRLKFRHSQVGKSRPGRKRPFAGYIRPAWRDKVLNIHVRLLGAYLDGHMELLYKRVHGINLSSPLWAYPLGLVDWMVDEMALSERGFMVHLIRMDVKVTWAIECEDFDYKWRPFREEPSSIEPDGTTRW